jgi:hypothetical protein
MQVPKKRKSYYATLDIVRGGLEGDTFWKLTFEN